MNLIEFVVTDLTLNISPIATSRSEVWMQVEFEREYVYHLSQSFFQSFLLSFLAYLTFWIDVDNFSDRFIGSLTCLLVLASLMAGMTASLPNTSYFKAIDIWLMYFLLATALNIAMHILIDIFKRRAEKQLNTLRSKTMTSNRNRKSDRPGTLTPVPQVMILKAY